jgi:hypothetical protein
LLYCEGKNTEPSYFNKFKLSTATIKAFGEDKNTLSLVNAAKRLSDDATEKGQPFDQVWCVFDADPKPDNPKQLQNFNDAVTLANRLGFGCAYSNQAFEYWLILHFEDHQGGGMQRTAYDRKLNGYLKPFNLNYDSNGSKKVSSPFFLRLFEILSVDRDNKPVTRCDLAIVRAERNYRNIGDHSNPGIEDSSTRVQDLVKVLLKYM